MTTAALEAPIEKLAVDPETIGNLVVALGAASSQIGVMPDVREALDEDLDPKRVKQVRGKDYLAEHDVVRTANRIFGYGKWGTTVVWHECVGSQAMKNSNGEDGWYTGYRCCVRLAVAGCEPVDGVGYGDAFEKQWSAQVTTHELAAKEAESDAIKRAFKKYGDQFGLILYAKADDKKRIAEEKAEAEYAKPATDEAVAAVVEKATAANFGEQTETAIAAERDAHALVRSGWLAKLDARLDEVAKTPEKAAVEPKPEAAAPTPQQAPAEELRPLDDGDRWATEDEVSSAISLAAMLDLESAQTMSAAVIANRAKNVDGGCSYAYLQKLADAVKKKIDAAGGAPGNVSQFAPPDSATKPASDSEVAQAFEEGAAA